MSAYILDKQDIDQLVDALVDHHIMDQTFASTTGRLLWGLNALSVMHRYPDVLTTNQWPGPFRFRWEHVTTYAHDSRPAWIDQRDRHELTALIDNWEGQSSLVPAWRMHPGAILIAALRASMRAEVSR